MEWKVGRLEEWKGEEGWKVGRLEEWKGEEEKGMEGWKVLLPSINTVNVYIF